LRTVPLSFRWESLNRSMRHPQAQWRVALALAGAILLLHAARVAFGGESLSGAAVVASITALLAGLLGYAAVLTWRRLWRKGRDSWEVLVYDAGVRGY
jgi:hypothetical protein